MTIPAERLASWCRQGGTTASINAHSSIRKALERYEWPKAVKYRVLLQGSYKNSTNIRGDSDVDVLVICTTTFFSNLNEAEKRRLKLKPGTITAGEFRNHTIAALQLHFGSARVDHRGANSVEVAQAEGSPAADVVPCLEYRNYRTIEPPEWTTGIRFQNQHTGQWISNYPGQHYDNCVAKSDATGGRFKETVRMFKNARAVLTPRSGRPAHKEWPSYMIECMLWNAPNRVFVGSPTDRFTNVRAWLLAQTSAPAGLKAANGIQDLFGSEPHQFSPDRLSSFASQLARL